MKRLASQPGFTAGALGLCILLQLAALRWLMMADAERVYVWGQPINVTCAFKRSFGVPCPTCGMTRSVVLALAGEWPLAWQINPAGPLLAAGLAALGVSLLALTLAKQKRRAHAARATRRWIQIWALGYGGLVIVVLFAHWARQLLAR